MALAHSLNDRSFFRDPSYFPPTVTFSPDHLDNIQTLYQIQHISGAIADLAKAALTAGGDQNYVNRARNEIAQLSSLLVSYSLSSAALSTSTELRTPKPEPTEIISPLPSPRSNYPTYSTSNSSSTLNSINTANLSNKRKHKSIQSQNLYCRSCGTTQTPEWRRGPDGGKSLCNACGLHYAKIMKREVLVPSRKTETTSEAMNLRTLLN